MSTAVSEKYTARLGLEGEPMGYVDGMNTYEALVDNPINRVDPSGMVSLTEKILLALAWRVSKVVALPVGGQVWNYINYFTGTDIYYFWDDENEMNPALNGRMKDYYRYLVQHVFQNQLTTEWQTFHVSLDDVKAKVGQFNHPNFFLNGAIDVLAAGSFQARLQNCHVYMRNIDMEWQWKDRIDANSFKEAWDRGNLKMMSVPEVLLEGLWDLGPEKLGAVDFFTIIKWKSFRWDDDPNGHFIAESKDDVESQDKAK